LINEVWVWPELQLVKKDAVFLFDFYPTSVPLLGAIEAQADGTPAATLSTSINAQSWAPILNSVAGSSATHEKFVLFSTPFTSPVRFQISGNDLQLTFGSPSLALSAVWDPEYAKHRRFDKVNTSLMQDELTKSLATDGARITLGTMALTSTLNLKAQKLNKRPSWLRVDF
jgi:hypothetical protein